MRVIISDFSLSFTRRAKATSNPSAGNASTCRAPTLRLSAQIRSQSTSKSDGNPRSRLRRGAESSASTSTNHDIWYRILVLRSFATLVQSSWRTLQVSLHTHSNTFAWARTARTTTTPITSMHKLVVKGHSFLAVGRLQRLLNSNVNYPN
jgi:hypothetical protein